MKTHSVYLFKQVFKDGRVMFARWSPTISRKHIKPFHSQEDQQAVAYLDAFNWPEIFQFSDPIDIPPVPFETVEVDDDAGA